MQPCLLAEQCERCGEVFDLVYDLDKRRADDVRFLESAPALLCWGCRK